MNFYDFTKTIFVLCLAVITNVCISFCVGIVIFIGAKLYVSIQIAGAIALIIAMAVHLYIRYYYVLQQMIKQNKEIQK
jgi:predicted RND superfamily exporter protein